MQLVQSWFCNGPGAPASCKGLSRITPKLGEAHSDPLKNVRDGMLSKLALTCLIYAICLHQDPALKARVGHRRA